MKTFMKRSSVSQSRSPQKVWCPSSVFSFQEYPWDYWEYSKLLWIMDYPKMRQWIVWGKWEKCFASSILNQVLIQVLHSVLSSLLHCWTVWLLTLLFVKRNQTLLLTNNKQISWKAAHQIWSALLRRKQGQVREIKAAQSGISKDILWKWTSIMLPALAPTCDTLREI